MCHVLDIGNVKQPSRTGAAHKFETENEQFYKNIFVKYTKHTLAYTRSRQVQVFSWKKASDNMGHIPMTSNGNVSVRVLTKGPVS